MLRACALVAVCGVCSSLFAQVGPIEWSEDHRLVASPLITPSDGVGATEAGVPLGTFAGWTLALRRQVGAVRIADMNNDGRNDLVVGCFISNSFPPYTDWKDMIFYANPDGTLPASPSWISADQIHTGDIQIGDMNGDGYNDLVAISGGTAFSPPRIYFGTPSGVNPAPGWVSVPPRTGWATGGLLFDVDADNDLDLLTTNQGLSPDPYRPMYLFLNAGGGGPALSPAWQSAESSIQNTAAAADHDADGDLDVAVSKWSGFQSGLYENTGTTLGVNPIWTVGNTDTDRGAAWGDVDGDGDPDLAIGGPTGTRLFTNTAGSLAQTYLSNPPFDSPQEIALADLDLDGDLDLFEVHFGDGRTHVYLNDAGSLSVTPSWTFDASEVANAIAVGDLDGDGLPDLAVGFSGDLSVRVFYNTLPDCPADLDGDYDADLEDFFGFFNCYDQELPCADIDGNPGVDLGDFFAFFTSYDAGCGV